MSDNDREFQTRAINRRLRKGKSLEGHGEQQRRAAEAVSSSAAETGVARYAARFGSFALPR